MQWTAKWQGSKAAASCLQRLLLAGAFGPLEQDDRAAAVRDLRQLQLAQMLPQRGQHRLIAGRRRLVAGSQHHHERELIGPRLERDNRQLPPLAEAICPESGRFSA